MSRTARLITQTSNWVLVGVLIVLLLAAGALVGCEARSVINGGRAELGSTETVEQPTVTESSFIFSITPPEVPTYDIIIVPPTEPAE